MTALEIAGLVALVTMATTILFLLRRANSTRAEAGLVELWRVAFDSSPIAMLIKHNGVYVHCNDACVHILGARDKSHVLEVGPAKVAPDRQPDGRLTADILRECAETLKQGKTYQHQALMGHTMNTNKPLYVDMYWVPVKYRGDDALLAYLVDASDRVRVANEARQQSQKIAQNFEVTIGGLAQSLATTAAEMRTASQDMSTTAKDASAQATSVLGTVEQASSNVQIVAAATEELSSSVSEIGRQVTQSTGSATWSN